MTPRLLRREGTRGLSLKERETLQMIADGCTNPAIASCQHVGVETVKSRVRSILFKMEAHTRAEAVAIGLRRGEIE